ncbi:MAG TPA: biotin--[acetyl-CoA-carboxylase] ligase [Acidimicrobiia bacterium]|nr:biotin--[acetyl-CoA-carboxylase] ligase [Acidimicrobiia bacterium]
MTSDAATWATVRARLAGTRFGELRVLDEVDSTNRVVLDDARAGAPEGLVVVAEHQTAGRGRLGRTWVAPPGGSLLLSVLLRPALPVERVHLVTMAAGVALADAVRDVAAVDATLKWPNDVLVGDRKLAGMLTEADFGPDGAVRTNAGRGRMPGTAGAEGAKGAVRAVVLGVGVNVNWGHVPDELAGLATACDLEAGHAVDRGALLAAFLLELDAHLRALERVPLEYRRRLATLGRRVRVELSDGPLLGRAVEVDVSGRLLVEVDSGCIVEVAAGDVVHLRDA